MESLGKTLRFSTTLHARLFCSTPKSDEGWLSKLLVRKIEPTTEPHSRMLSDKDTVYALHTHNIKPNSVDKYLKNYNSIVDLMYSHKEKNCAELVGSWTVSVGDMDQALHLWKFVGGFDKIDMAKDLFLKSSEYKNLDKEQAAYVRSRHLQYLLAFSFWPVGEPRTGSNIYEIRTYRLEPGTMIEWGNNWARGLNFRRSRNEAFAGYFSQIGRLYNVHHIWCYRDLQTRRETRESTWRKPGWDECVAYTVPLIKEMHCRILEPTEFSPTQLLKIYQSVGWTNSTKKAK